MFRLECGLIKTVGNLKPQGLILCCHYQLHFSEPKIYFKGSTSRAHVFCLALSFKILHC